VITADYFEGHPNLITLNHSSRRVQECVREVMLHWLRRAIHEWRLDAAYAVPARFWAAVLPAVREEFPDAWFVGKMIHGDYIDNVKTSGLDSVTEYELWWAIWSSIETVNFHELRWTLGRHAKFVEHFLPLTFLGNHDLTRIASQISDPRHDRTLWRCSVSGREYRRSTTATSSVWRQSKNTAPAAMTRYGQKCRRSGGSSHSHPEVERVYRIELRRRTPGWSTR
jgi:glycosidase